MPNKVTKAAGNRYCQARLKAAQYNDKLSSRASASEELSGISEDSLKKYELGLVNPPTEAVVIMADAYNAPELLSWYCSNECPIGKGRIYEAGDMPPERACIRGQMVAATIGDAIDKFSKIWEDGIVDYQEHQMLPDLEKRFSEYRKRIDEIIVQIRKARAQEPEQEG